MYSRQIQSRQGGMLRGDRVGRKAPPRASPCSGFAMATHGNRTSAHKSRGRSLMRISAVAAESKEAKAASALNEKLQISTETARELYKDMKLCREFEEMCAQMYYRGKMFGFVHLYSGQEACSTGVIKTLGPLDHVCSTYRDHAHAISKGVPAKYVLAELFGKKTGVCRGQGGSMHMFSKEHRLLGGYAFIGEGIPIGVGAAFQAKYKHDVLGDKDSPMEVTASFFGDGTCNIGQFYECLNMASLYKLPHVFVVENNLWAIGMSHLRSTATEEQDNFPYIYKKGPAFGMPGVRVDGMDLLKVREVAMTAVDRARRGEGPTLIECETYRYRGHSLADPDELRDKKEKELYAARDPLPRFRKHVVSTGLLTEEQLSEIDAQVAEEVEAAVTFAEESPRPDKSQLLENVYADPRGFGIGPDGNYRYKSPGFTSGSVAVS